MALTEKNRCSNALGLRTQTTSINHAWSIGGLSAQTRAIHSIPQLGFQPRGAGFQGGSRVRVQMPVKHPVRVQVDHYRQMPQALRNPIVRVFRRPFRNLAEFGEVATACSRCHRQGLPGSDCAPLHQAVSTIFDTWVLTGRPGESPRVVGVPLRLPVLDHNTVPKGTLA
jgi:hypothetical protein